MATRKDYELLTDTFITLIDEAQPDFISGIVWTIANIAEALQNDNANYKPIKLYDDLLFTIDNMDAQIELQGLRDIELLKQPEVKEF